MFTLKETLALCTVFTFWLVWTVAIIDWRVLGRVSRKRLGTLLWLLHAGIFWTVAVYVRFIIGYTLPMQEFMQLWSYVIYMHATIAFIGEILLSWKYRNEQ